MMKTNTLGTKLKLALFVLTAMLAGCNSDKKDSVVEITPERTGHSVAHMWNEVVLDAIRNDYARPTVHARNLFHISSAMYDSWSTYNNKATPFLFGQVLNSYECKSVEVEIPEDVLPSQETAISYATYRLISHRFANSPGAGFIQNEADVLMNDLGLDTDYDSLDYINGENKAAALGNYIANCYIEFGLTDGSNEQNDYANTSYKPINPNIKLGDAAPGNPDVIDMNRWQRIELDNFIDQAGNLVTGIPEFLGAEWGQVVPFALSENDKVTFNRDGFDYQVYHNPGQPPYIGGVLSDQYKWGFSMVSIWSSHLDESDDTMVDISPASLGNIQSFPSSVESYDQFYNFIDGGDSSQGYALNPSTNQPYEPQMVPRADYARVLAEFWADGPSSETPPGHWFTILNTVSDHPQLVKRWSGQGETLGNLEWDVKTYFALGGTMHDAAIAAWGVKGWYDYVRPVAAIRAMADLGQSTDENLPSYHVNGIPLVDNYIELVTEGDPLVGENNEHLNKIKLYAWKGPSYIEVPSEDVAGVGWILAERWWTYQRPSFVTPPFAGYVSGHSTFSRAAAELMTLMTGDAYFPGGMSGFDIKANEFLVFERGPSVDMTLQWATYRDASDQCSLSRIWGGIHPPADDIPGRKMGLIIGPESFEKANAMFNGN